MAFTSLPITIVITLLTQLPPGPEQADRGHEDRLRFIKEKASRLDLSYASTQESLTLTAEPVLRFSNPERDRGTWDGATFLWLDRKRPVSAASFGLRRPNNDVFFEFTSFVAAPLTCKRGETVLWAPLSGSLIAQPLANVSPAADLPASRLTQMRDIARRFSAKCVYKEETASQLRLLPQPIYRFADEEAHIRDGAVFVMVISNDPEILLLIEALSDSSPDKPQWRYSVCRMSSQQQIVRFDNEEIATFPAFYQLPPAERKAGPYTESFQGKYRPPGLKTSEK